MTDASKRPNSRVNLDKAIERVYGRGEAAARTAGFTNGRRR